MPVKLRFSGQLFRCGRCRKSYSNPLGHVRVSSRRTGRRRLKPRARLSLAVCGNCGKEYSNPLGHVCVVKSGLRKRKAAAKRSAATEARREKARAARAREVAARRKRREKETAARQARRAREDEARRRRKAAERPAAPGNGRAHDWRNCRDHDCERPACEAYREGIADGEERAS